jgi:hypothetical protein
MDLRECIVYISEYQGRQRTKQMSHMTSFVKEIISKVSQTVDNFYDVSIKLFT